MIKNLKLKMQNENTVLHTIGFSFFDLSESFPVSGLKDRHNTAQGNALGSLAVEIKALKGRHKYCHEGSLTAYLGRPFRGMAFT